MPPPRSWKRSPARGRTQPPLRATPAPGMPPRRGLEARQEPSPRPPTGRAARTRHRPAAARRAAGRRGAGDRQFEPGARPGSRPAARAAPLSVLHQRGAAGIDGLVAGAAGARSVSRRRSRCCWATWRCCTTPAGLPRRRRCAGRSRSSSCTTTAAASSSGCRRPRRRAWPRRASASSSRRTGAFDGLAATWGLGYARSTPRRRWRAPGAGLASPTGRC